MPKILSTWFMDDPIEGQIRCFKTTLQGTFFYLNLSKVLKTSLITTRFTKTKQTLNFVNQSPNNI